ncbi:MAG: hypothetical protein WDN29_14960 [Methylovirgula sp.]
MSIARDDLESTVHFFENALHALENAQTRGRVIQIKFKADAMAMLAKRLSDSALHAEANMVSRITMERLLDFPEDETRPVANGSGNRVSVFC